MIKTCAALVEWNRAFYVNLLVAMLRFSYLQKLCRIRVNVKFVVSC